MPNTLKVGAAKADITPSKNVLPMPFFFLFEMDEAIDPIHVRVLDIESGNERVLFATFDTTFVPNPPETQRYICELTGLDKNHVFLAATHTHCAPMVGIIDEKATPDEKHVIWYKEIKTAIKKAVEEAAKNKRPAKMGFGTGKSYVNINRDELNESGKAVIGVNFERDSDKTLNILEFQDESGKPIAFVVNYAVHATVMNGCVIDRKIKVTGDLPGVTSNSVESKFDGAVCLWTSGAAGDQNPRFGTQFPEENVTDFTSIKNLGATGHYVLEFLAKEHTQDILRTLKTIKCDQSDVKITSQEISVKCAGRTPEAAKMIAAAQNITLPPPADVEYSLRLVTLGDVAVQGISAEVVTSIGKAVLAISTAKHTMLVTHMDTVKGYCPDDWEYEHNAFEAEGAAVAQGEAQREFVNGFKSLFANVK